MKLARIAREAAALSDGDLWVRLRERDMASLEALYSRYGSYVYGLALRMLAKPEEAEEVVQDVFWQLWKKELDYDPVRGGFRTWLFAITRSRCLDRLRRHRKSTLEPRPSPAPSSPEQEAYLGERQRHVVAAFRDLPEPQRLALEMGFFEGLTHRQIAERLGEPLGTIKSRIKMGMDKLNESLRSFEES
ncbi:MAG: sigma-70 family RNA polymerase sigma factor [Vicinamibacteria bacterium]